MKPLSGIRIAVTRAAAQSSELVEPLAQAGAEVYACPLIRIEPYILDQAARSTIARAAEFNWLIFTSANGVDQFMRLFDETGGDRAALRASRIACVGPATAAVLREHDLSPAAVPASFTGVAVAAALFEQGAVAGRKVLIARASGGGQALPAQLREHGADVVDLELYRSVLDPDGAKRLNDLAAQGKVDLVTFTSGSAVDYFVETVDTHGQLIVAVIGPSTAQAARERGLVVDIEADPHTTSGLVTGILNYYAARRGTLEV
jgi:uroporphyrinogen III methyltransferase / synthase